MFWFKCEITKFLQSAYITPQGSDPGNWHRERFKSLLSKKVTRFKNFQGEKAQNAKSVLIRKFAILYTVAKYD